MNPTNSAAQTMAFIGRRSCGCVVSAHVDDGDTYTLDWVRDMAKDGLAIEYVPASGVALDCPHLAAAKRRAS